MPSFGARLIAALLLSLSAAFVAQAQTPKRVLLLHSWGPEFGDLYAREMRVQLSRQFRGRLDLYEEWLVSARFPDRHDDTAFAKYLNDLFADHPLDLIITLGAPAANFVQRYHQSLFRTTPELLADVEERRTSSLAPNEAVVAGSVSIPAVVQNILRVRPHTNTLAVVIGDSANERYWVEQIGLALVPFKNRITLKFLNGLPFNEVLKRVATLPKGSAVLYALLSPDVEGIPLDEDTALGQLHAVADAPIFSYADAYLGKGIVGGPLLSGEEEVRETIGVATRLLSGEPTSEIHQPPFGLGRPEFDWRELKRWNIRESDLPPGSRILFREPSVWERYRWQMLSVAAVLLLETALIIMLLHERRRRRQAEMNAHRHIAELARMNRRSTVGELSASIAHELAQPLSAILRNTEAAELILHGASRSDFRELEDIMIDIARDQQRASEVIRRLRSLLAKSPAETQELDLNEVLREVFELLSAQAAAHRVIPTTSLAPRALMVRGDRIQLQQVILNLVMNSIEAIGSAASRERRVTGRITVVGTSAEVSIEDTGPGIPPDKVDQIFEPFFSTKDAGMGMGLSIARTIILSHRGRIWAANRREGGAVFRFTVPLAAAEQYATGVPTGAKPSESAAPGSRPSGGFDTAQILGSP